MSHDRGCPCGADKGDPHFDHCRWKNDKPERLRSDFLDGPVVLKTRLRLAEEEYEKIDKELADNLIKQRELQDKYGEIANRKGHALKKVKELRKKIR